MTIQKKFADNVVEAAIDDESVVGLAAEGSWLTDAIDEFSALDLILVQQSANTHTGVSVGANPLFIFTQPSDITHKFKNVNQ